MSRLFSSLQPISKQDDAHSTINPDHINVQHTKNDNNPWNCSMCMLLNDPSASICGVCGNTKPAEKETFPHQPELVNIENNVCFVFVLF